MTQPVTAVLFGAGLRGADAYAPYALAHPDELKFAAEQSRHEKIVVDMDDYRQQADSGQFNSLARTSSRLVYHGRGDDHAQNHVYWSWKYCVC